MSSDNPAHLTLEIVKGTDKNGLSFTAYLLCNSIQRMLLKSETPIDLTGFEIVFKKMGDVTEQEHKEVIEFFEKTYLTKRLADIGDYKLRD